MSLWILLAVSVNSQSATLEDLYEELDHPRILHFLRSRNLTFSTKDVKEICVLYRVCAKLKPPGRTLMKATGLLGHISIRFKGPLPMVTHNLYMLVIYNEYSW